MRVSSTTEQVKDVSGRLLQNKSHKVAPLTFNVVHFCLFVYYCCVLSRIVMGFYGAMDLSGDITGLWYVYYWFTGNLMFFFPAADLL